MMIMILISGYHKLIPKSAGFPYIFLTISRKLLNFTPWNPENIAFSLAVFCSGRRERSTMIISTLCYVEKDDATKKKNDVNHNKWIGVGGKLEKGESPEECLLREVREETGLSLTAFRYRGLLSFIYEDREPEYIFTYTADGYEGSLTDCNEGDLRWVRKSDIPGLELWEGDRYMLELLLKDEGGCFSLKFCYDRDDRLVSALSLLPSLKKLK